MVLLILAKFIFTLICQAKELELLIGKTLRVCRLGTSVNASWRSKIVKFFKEGFGS